MSTTTIQTIPPFFNAATTTAPPPFPPLLTDQQELLGKRSQQSGLLADEALYAESGVIPHSKTRSAVDSAPPPGRPFKLAHGPSPYLKKAVGRKQCPPQSVDSLSELSDCLSETSSDSDDASSTLSENPRIPKPPGEPGRPGRGGYNLETALNWNHKAFSKLKKLTHRLIDEHLDTSKCASVQSPVLLQCVRDQALAATPDLENYSNCWPVNDLIMMHLKYTSGRARRQEEIPGGKGKKGAKK